MTETLAQRILLNGETLISPEAFVVSVVLALLITSARMYFLIRKGISSHVYAMFFFFGLAVFIGILCSIGLWILYTGDVWHAFAYLVLDDPSLVDSLLSSKTHQQEFGQAHVFDIQASRVLGGNWLALFSSHIILAIVFIFLMMRKGQEKADLRPSSQWRYALGVGFILWMIGLAAGYGADGRVKEDLLPTGILCALFVLWLWRVRVPYKSLFRTQAFIVPFVIWIILTVVAMLFSILFLSALLVGEAGILLTDLLIFFWEIVGGGPPAVVLSKQQIITGGQTSAALISLGLWMIIVFVVFIRASEPMKKLVRIRAISYGARAFASIIVTTAFLYVLAVILIHPAWMLGSWVWETLL